MSGDAPPTQVRIVWLDGSRSECCDGVLRRQNPTGVAVDLPTDAIPWEPQTRVVLVRGTGANRVSAPATFVLGRGGTAVFTLLKPWKVFDPRATPRFPLHVPTRIQIGESDETRRGTVLDISAGGLCLEVVDAVRARRVQVPLFLDGYAATLACEVVGTSGGAGRHILHLRFLHLEPAQAAFIRNMLGAIAGQLDANAGAENAA